MHNGKLKRKTVLVTNCLNVNCVYQPEFHISPLHHYLNPGPMFLLSLIFLTHLNVFQLSLINIPRLVYLVSVCPFLFACWSVFFVSSQVYFVQPISYTERQLNVLNKDKRKCKLQLCKKHQIYVKNKKKLKKNCKTKCVHKYTLDQQLKGHKT